MGWEDRRKGTKINGKMTTQWDEGKRELAWAGIAAEGKKSAKSKKLWRKREKDERGAVCVELVKDGVQE